MGFDLYGKAPTTKEGEYFRRSIWYWGPLADLCLSVAPKECSPCREWHSNDGDGLNGNQADRLAAALEQALLDGRIEGHIRSLRSRPDDERREGGTDTPRGMFRSFIRTLKEEAEFRDNVSEGDVREFISFLKGSGGFEIC